MTVCSRFRHIKVENLVITILFLIILEIPSVPYLIPIPFKATSYASLLVAVILSALIIRRKRMSSICIICLIYVAYYVGISAAFKLENMLAALRMVSSPLAVLLFTEYYLPKKKYDFLKIILKIMIILTCIDLMTILAFPNGMYRSELYWSNWFLGYQSQRVRMIGIPMVVISAILTIKKYKKITAGFMMVALLALIDSYLSEATAGTASLAFLTVLIMVFFIVKKESFQKKLLRILNPKFVLTVVIILNALFAILQNYGVFEFFITNIFGKDMSLSHRSIIWLRSMQLFIQRPILGHGYIQSETYVMLTGYRGGTQPHNLLLGIMVYTGIVGLALVVFLLIKTSKYVSNDIPRFTSIAMLGIISYFLFGITSFTLFSQFLYAFFVFVYYLRKLESGELIKQT